MLINERRLKRQSMLLSLAITIITSLLLALYMYGTLKEQIKYEILPNTAQGLDDLALHTQNQLQFIQFTTVHYESIIKKLKKSREKINLSESFGSLKECLTRITTNQKTLDFANRKVMRDGEIENYNGALLGYGDITSYSNEDLSLMCTVLTSSQANSESIRLINKDNKVSSFYYFVSRFNDYFLLYNTTFSESLLTKYKVPEVKKSFESLNKGGDSYWITKPYSDGITNKLVISLVKNIIDYTGQVTGFLVRDFYVSDLEETFLNYLNKMDSELELFEYAELQIINDNMIIYQNSEFRNDQHDGTIVIENSTSDHKWSDFGPVTIRVDISKISFILLMLKKYDFLLILPFFIFIFSYMISSQILKGFSEGDKQYFDMLTKTYNRNGLHRKVYKKIDKYVTCDRSAHIFSIDANKFKQINDNYGHNVGDRAIKIIATAAKHISKDADDVVRLGGDEFLIVLYISNKQEFDSDGFLERLNQKIAYDCKAQSIPLFTVCAGYVVFDFKSRLSLSQVIAHADVLLLNKKSIKKIEIINEEFDNFSINLSDEGFERKLELSESFNFIETEHLLQSELSSQLLHTYQCDLNYLLSNYFQMMYYCTRDNDDLHQYRMKIVESHYHAGVSMSVFYFLFVKYSTYLLKNTNLTQAEIAINNQVLSYELHFISSLKMR